jgi:hypothetical protein
LKIEPLFLSVILIKTMGKRDKETGTRRKKSDKRREKHDRQGKFTKKGIRIFIATATRKKKVKRGGKRK